MGLLKKIGDRLGGKSPWDYHEPKTPVANSEVKQKLKPVELEEEKEGLADYIKAHRINHGSLESTLPEGSNLAAEWKNTRPFTAKVYDRNQEREGYEDPALYYKEGLGLTEVPLVFTAIDGAEQIVALQAELDNMAIQIDRQRKEIALLSSVSHTVDGKKKHAEAEMTLTKLIAKASDRRGHMEARLRQFLANAEPQLNFSEPLFGSASFDGALDLINRQESK